MKSKEEGVHLDTRTKNSCWIPELLFGEQHKVRKNRRNSVAITDSSDYTAGRESHRRSRTEGGIRGRAGSLGISAAVAKREDEMLSISISIPSIHPFLGWIHQHILVGITDQSDVVVVVRS